MASQQWPSWTDQVWFSIACQPGGPDEDPDVEIIDDDEGDDEREHELGGEGIDDDCRGEDFEFDPPW
jgi:hypothetical protein